MDAAADLVDFVPDSSQLARVAPATPAAPPVWLAVAAIAGALGLSLSMALPPATHVRGGAVSSRAAIDEAAGDTRTPDAPRPGEVFQLPAWHDEAGE